MQSELYNDSARKLATSHSSFVINLTIAYTIVFSAILMLALVPRIARLEKEIQQRKSLLILLPPELITGLPEVRDIVLGVIDETEAGEAGVAAARAAASATVSHALRGKT